MIKNRTAQLIYQTIYCTLGLVGFVASFGIFDNINVIRWDFYVHFTNVSNFLCIGIMVASLILTIKRKEDGYVTTNHIIKFIGLLAILLTFVVFNAVLANAEGREPQANWRVGSILFHIVLPIMYVVDWFLFYERKKCKWYYPLISISFPLGYVIFLLLQATILGFNTSILIPTTETPLIYPYFFVNLETEQFKVLMWVGLFAVAFAAVGYIFYGLDKISFKSFKNNKHK